MDFDLEPLDEGSAGVPVQNARKFLPKARSKPAIKKQPSATLVSTSQAAQTIDSPQSELSELVGTAKPSENLVSGSDVGPDNDGGQQDSMEKSLRNKSSDVFIPSEGLGDFHTSDMGSVVPNDLIVPTTDGQDQMHDGDLVREEIDVVNNILEEGSIPTFEEDIVLYLSSPEFTHTIATSECPSNEKPDLPSMDFIHTVATSECPLNEEPNLPSMDFIHTVATSECPSNEEPNLSSMDFTHTVATSECPSNEEPNLSSMDFTHTVATSECPSNEEPNLSSMDFTHTVATSECPSNEEPMNLMEESVHEIPAKLASRRAKTGTSNTETASDPSPEQQEMGRSLRPRKNKAGFFELVDEDEEVSEEYVLEEENIDDNEESQVVSEPPKKNPKRKSKISKEDKEKPTRKRKKATEASDKEACVAKPKKFSHSTRRRRVVDKALLMIPDEEFDREAVPLRDLIARADYLEKQEKKDKAAKAAQARTQSTGNSSAPYNEEETFVSRQGGEFNDDEQGNPVAEDTTQYFNYHTFMVKAPSTRWSKQDTELFYEAVRQFGSDLSMIQLRFPDRERVQLKRKYKKEEREHPMRLRDALTNRTKDLSYLQELVKQIKQQEAEEKQEAGNEDPIDLAEDEVADEQNLNAAKDEEPIGGQVQEEENNPGEVQEEENNPVADDVDVAEEEESGDDDFFDWSQYKSDV